MQHTMLFFSLFIVPITSMDDDSTYGGGMSQVDVANKKT